MMKRVATLGMLAVLAVAARASALTIDGGPVYAGTASTPVSGASCTVAGTPCATGGATVTCTGLPTGAILYYGIKTNSFVEGDTEVLTTGPVATSAAVFRFSSTTATSITYTGTTSLFNSIQAATRTVTTQNVLTLTSGTASVVATGGTAGPPADSAANGDIRDLFKPSTAAIMVTVNVQAKDADFTTFGNSCPTVFDPSHSRAPATDQDVSHVDLGFYWQNTNADQHRHPDEYTNRYPDQYHHRNTYGHAVRHADGHRHPDRDADRHPNRHANGHADAYC